VSRRNSSLLTLAAVAALMARGYPVGQAARSDDEAPHVFDKYDAAALERAKQKRERKAKRRAESR
jgi:hypothetical protein